MSYQPRHARRPAPDQLPPAMRGLADQIEPAGTRGYRARHSKREDT